MHLPMLDMPPVIGAQDGDETTRDKVVVSIFAERLRTSAEARAGVLARERAWFDQQLLDLRTKAAADEKRGWTVRRALSA